MNKEDKSLLRLLLLQYMLSENQKMEVSSAKVEDSKLNVTSTGIEDPLEFRERISDRDYKCKKIGNKIWMMENLHIDPKSLGFNYEGNTIYNPGNDEWYYTWDDAMKISSRVSVTSSGWHLPSSEEWNQLALDLGGRDSGGYVDSGLKDFIFDKGIISKMNIKLSGYYYGSFLNLGSYSYFWTSTEYDSSNAYNRYLDTGTSLYSGNYSKTYGRPIRLVKDS